MKQDKATCKSLSNVEQTLLVMLAGRVIAQRDFPELDFSDPYAEKMAKMLDVDVEKYTFDVPLMKASAYRAKWFDKRAATFLQANPNGLVISLGAGLSSAYYRVSSKLSTTSHRWVDIDMPQVIELKQKLLIQDRNYCMLAGDVTDHSWMKAVEWQPGRPVLVIMEGLIMYLTKKTGAKLFKEVAAFFGKEQNSVEILFDYDSPAMVKYPAIMTPAIASTGASYSWALKRAKDITKFDCRYEVLEEHNPWPKCGVRMRFISRLHRVLMLGRHVYGFAHARMNRELASAY